jgi:hypothetical protein
MEASDVGIDARSSAMTAKNLIASDRVEGTEVRRSDGITIGSIRRLMIDKPSGRVVYAIMSLTGASDQPDDQRALPWKLLRYNTTLGAYEIELTNEQFWSAPPRLSDATDDASFDRAWEEHVHSYFHTEPYWNSETDRATDSPLGKEKG